MMAQQKKDLQPVKKAQQGNKIHIKRGDLVLIDFGDKKHVQGSEQHGIRPAIIIQNDVGNKFSPTTIVVPITKSKTKKLLPTHVHIEKSYLAEMGHAHNSIALLEQVKTVDKGRIVKHLGKQLKPSKLKEIDKALLVSIGL